MQQSVSLSNFSFSCIVYTNVQKPFKSGSEGKVRVRTTLKKLTFLNLRYDLPQTSLKVSFQNINITRTFLRFKKTLRIWVGPLDREHNSLFHWHIMYFYVWRGEGTILNFKAFSGYIVTVITISKDTSYMSKMTFNTFLVNTNN